MYDLSFCVVQRCLQTFSRQLLSFFWTGVALASTLHITSEQLVECWAAHSLNKNVNVLDNHTFEPFRQQVIKECGDNMEIMNTGAVMTRVPTAKRQLPEKNIPNVTPPSKKSGMRVDSTSIRSKPVTASRRVSMSPELPLSLRKNDAGPSSDKYNDRRDSGKVISSFNPKDMENYVSTKERPVPKCEINCSEFDTNVKESYRHMFTTIEERAKALDKHILTVGDCLKERYGLGKQSNASENEAALSEDVAALEEVGVARQDKVCNIGRICNAVSLYFIGRLMSCYIFSEL